MTDKIAQIKNRLDLRTALQRFTSADPTKLRGAKGNIPCPFHHDKSPSFLVDLRTDHWHCFAGCGSGDVINLYSVAFGVDNTEAIQQLCGLLGIADEPVTPELLERLQRARQERVVISKASEKVNMVSSQLCVIYRKMHEYMAATKSMEDVELIASIYHAEPHIGYLLECLSGDHGDDLVDAYFQTKEAIKKWQILI